MLPDVSEKSQSPGPVQINLRVSEAKVDALDAWVEEINARRGWPKITRTDVLRKLLDWGLKERPAWVEE